MVSILITEVTKDLATVQAQVEEMLSERQEIAQAIEDARQELEKLLQAVDFQNPQDVARATEWRKQLQAREEMLAQIDAMILETTRIRDELRAREAH